MVAAYDDAVNGTQCWETNGDNADGVFYDGPNFGVNVRPTCILVGETLNRNGAVDTGYADAAMKKVTSMFHDLLSRNGLYGFCHLQATQQENPHQLNFSIQSHLQFPDHRDWQDDGHEVTKHVDRSGDASCQ